MAAVPVDLAARLRAAIEAPDPFAAGLSVGYLPQLAVPGGELACVEALVHVGPVRTGPPGSAAPRPAAEGHPCVPRLGRADRASREAADAAPPFVPSADDRAGAPHHDALLDLLDEPALLERLTLAVIQTAGEDSVAWRLPGDEVPIGVNLPSAKVLRAGFTDRLTARLERIGLGTHSFAVELAAGQFAAAPDQARAELARLRLQGVRVVIDAFGAHPVDREALRRGTADAIKLDPKVIADLVDDAARERITELIAAAHEAGIKVVAGGVTDDRQLDRLRLLGIDAVQGPLLAEPVDLLSFSGWVAQQFPGDRGGGPLADRAPRRTAETVDRKRPPVPTGPSGSGGREQRFAPRKAWRGQPAFLRVPVEGWRNTSNRLPVKIADYSWTGVGFFLDEHIVLPAEWEVVLEIDTVSIPMHVRRSAAVERSRLTYHGAEFVAPSPEFAAELERVALHRVDDVRSTAPDIGAVEPAEVPTRKWILPTEPPRAERATRRGPRQRRAGSAPSAAQVRDPASDPPAAAPPPVGLATPSEKRIGRRHEVHHPITLIPPARRRRRPRAIPGQIFDLSVSGAGVVARTDPAILPGRVLEIEIDGRRGGARIRRVTHDAAAGQTSFGLEFTDERLSSTIVSILDAHEDDARALGAGSPARR